MTHTAITLYGTPWCGDCKRTKKFLGEQRVHYNFVDIDADAEGAGGVIAAVTAGLALGP